MIAIRRGSAWNIEAAVAIWDAAQTARRGIETHAPDLPQLLKTRLDENGACLLIAEKDAKTVGSAMVSPARHPSGDGEIGDVIEGLGHISIISVKPSLWGLGIGQQLTTALLAEIARAGYREAQLWTQETNIRAIRLYSSFGFSLTGDEKYDDNDEKIQRYKITVA